MKEYLGDGVYARQEHDSIVLTTEDGINVTNTIILDIDTWYALKEFAKRNIEP
jgi:hypothetical protein